MREVGPGPSPHLNHTKPNASRKTACSRMRSANFYMRGRRHFSRMLARALELPPQGGSSIPPAGMAGRALALRGEGGCRCECGRCSVPRARTARASGSVNCRDSIPRGRC